MELDLQVAQIQQMLDHPETNGTNDILKGRAISMTNNSLEQAPADRLQQQILLDDLTIALKQRTFGWKPFSMSFPNDFFKSISSTERSQLYTNAEHELSICCTREQCPEGHSAERNIEPIKQVYLKQMEQSKQKTIFMEDGCIQAINIPVYYFVVNHPMPKKKIFIVIAITRAIDHYIVINMCGNHSDFAKWSILMKAMLYSIKIE